MLIRTISLRFTDSDSMMNRKQVVGTFLFIIGIAWSYHALAVFLMKPCGALNQCLTTATATFAIPVIMIIVGVYLFRD